MVFIISNDKQEIGNEENFQKFKFRWLCNKDITLKNLFVSCLNNCYLFIVSYFFTWNYNLEETVIVT